VCIACREAGWLHRDPGSGWARPLFHEETTCGSPILLVYEAPNFGDTYDPQKGRLTCNRTTDPSGRFTHRLLEHVGLRPEDVIITNSVLCLPARGRDRGFPVFVQQRKTCARWLRRFIVDLDIEVVVTCGANALEATRLVHRHEIILAESVGVVVDWFDRKLLPLYHSSALGRLNRPEPRQFVDIEALLPFVSTPEAG